MLRWGAQPCRGWVRWLRWWHLTKMLFIIFRSPYIWTIMVMKQWRNQGYDKEGFEICVLRVCYNTLRYLWWAQAEVFPLKSQVGNPTGQHQPPDDKDSCGLPDLNHDPCDLHDLHHNPCGNNIQHDPHDIVSLPTKEGLWQFWDIKVNAADPNFSSDSSTIAKSRSARGDIANEDNAEN